MPKPNKYLDIAILLLLCYTTGVAVYYHTEGANDLSVRNYIGIVLLVLVIGAKLFMPAKFKLSVLLLLGLGVFNIASFTLYKVSAAIRHGGGTPAANIINPLLLLLLIIYLVVNRRFIRSYYRLNKEEAEIEKSKLIAFYYDKFRKCDSEEIEQALSMYDEYPHEAQIALHRLHQERKLDVLKFD